LSTDRALVLGYRSGLVAAVLAASCVLSAVLFRRVTRVKWNSPRSQHWT
jgi:hypothetical protein